MICPLLVISLGAHRLFYLGASTMSFIAQRQIVPSADDVTDVDDKNETVTAGEFWPVIALSDLRLAARIAGDITTTRLKHAASEAVAHVTEQLEEWQDAQQQAGHATLGAVPASQLNGESVRLYRYRRAVYSLARASILEGYRDVTTTAKGEKSTDALDLQIDDLWRDVRWCIADIQKRPRVFAELF